VHDDRRRLTVPTSTFATTRRESSPDSATDDPWLGVDATTSFGFVPPSVLGGGGSPELVPPDPSPPQPYIEIPTSEHTTAIV
jgi:hypothetical protein